MLERPLVDLLRLQNVATRRRDRISSDEEERQRQGYEVRTAVQFTEHDGASVGSAAAVAASDGSELLALAYGQAATIWRVNLGWTRRAHQDTHGFVLDTERGYWAKDDKATPDDPDDRLSSATRRVIPFVEDRRNCLLVEPSTPLEAEQMASLQAALKRAIQAEYQLEDQELAAEPLPTADVRNVLLFFEAAEGGAGVLRRLVEDEGAIARVAARALELCHYAPDGTDVRRARNATEDCELACYDCLLSYGNQRDHRILDRTAIRALLLDLASASTTAQGGGPGPDDHADFLRRRCDSDLERAFVDLLVEQRRKLPDEPQKLIAAAQARPDFVYTRHQLAVFVDGPIHDETDKRHDDAATDARLDDLGWEVVRFHYAADWPALLDRFPGVFGANGR
jgi:very-short-patch-repair endonuclease